ncbi:MAG: tetratricopeptide repeat protein [Phycisphaerae bacterium]|nr:tetratricopeptide repeat protein [Phycisphaerae bacterium]
MASEETNVSNASSESESTWDINALFDNAEPLTDQQFKQLTNEVRNGDREREQFLELVDEIVEEKSDELNADPTMIMKVAQGYYAARSFQKAIQWFNKTESTAKQTWLKAMALKALGQYKEAIEAFRQAEKKGCDSFQVAMAVVNCLRTQGDYDNAEKHLKQVARVGEIRAEYHYQMGRLHDKRGNHQGALEELDKAVELDGNHSKALFHLAYQCDLFGDESLAIDLYKRCIETGRAPLTALLNLAVLYEDAEEYSLAAQSVRQVLYQYPNHKRAQMFLKDIESSKTMYFDEDQERRTDTHNKILEIPISDFELSVRSRNCLKKMNIRTLGDLLRVTESELLAYKNFGETSLQEIKIILTSKSLRLGQMLEETKKVRSNKEPEQAPVEVPEVNQEILEKPIGDLELSVRSRKCLERLNLETIGDLVNCTEAELLGCKNFGLTSLVEVNQRLEQNNLVLRKLDDEE